MQQSESDRRLGELVKQFRVPAGGFSRGSPTAAAAAASSGDSGSVQPRKITAVLVGAGNRGGTYTTYALENPELIQIVAVCDPNAVRRSRVAADHQILEENCYENWEDLLAGPRPKLADAVLICTQDQAHLEPATGEHSR
jgi:hypothetical protein